MPSGSGRQRHEFERQHCSISVPQKPSRDHFRSLPLSRRAASCVKELSWLRRDFHLPSLSRVGSFEEFKWGVCGFYHGFWAWRFWRERVFWSEMHAEAPQRLARFRSLWQSMVENCWTAPARDIVEERPLKLIKWVFPPWLTTIITHSQAARLKYSANAGCVDLTRFDITNVDITLSIV